MLVHVNLFLSEPLTPIPFIKPRSEWGAAKLIFIFNQAQLTLQTDKWEGLHYKLFKKVFSLYNIKLSHCH